MNNKLKCNLCHKDAVNTNNGKDDFYFSMNIMWAYHDHTSTTHSSLVYCKHCFKNVAGNDIILKIVDSNSQ